MDVGAGDVFFADACVQVDAFHVVVPFAVYLRIAQQAFVEPEIADEEVGAHYGLV